MFAKDKMIKVISEDGMLDGCKVSDRSCLINTLFDKIPKEQLEKVKDYIIDGDVLEILQDDELMNCVENFFNNNLNISETSRNAFLHRNTLIYRIDKIYKATGFNIKNFNDAVSFKLLLMIYNKFYK